MPFIWLVVRWVLENKPEDMDLIELRSQQHRTFAQVVPSVAMSCPCPVPILTGATKGRCVSAQLGAGCVTCCVLWKMVRSGVSWRWCWPCHQRRVTEHREGRVTGEQGAITPRWAVAWARGSMQNCFPKLFLLARGKQYC